MLEPKVENSYVEASVPIYCKKYFVGSSTYLLNFFDLQHLFITPGLGQTYSQSLCQQRTEMGVAVHVFSELMW